MLQTVSLVAALFLGSELADEPVGPADALIPENGSIVTVEASKMVIEETPGPHDWLVKHQTIVKLVELTNQHRSTMGLQPVKLDTQMCLDAQRHATWMSTYNSFQHSGLPYMEIIHQSVPTPEAAIIGWINSPAHHGIMLSGSQVGFGYMNLNGYPYWVGVFR